MNNSRQNTRLRWRDAAKLENLAGELIDTTAEGNVQFGKDIEVDGNIIVNGSDNIVDKGGNPVITGGGGGVSKSYVDAADQKLQGEINTKQAALTQTQLDATNSGITSAKVATYDGYATGKQDTLTAGTNITIENNVISATGGGGTGGGFEYIDVPINGMTAEIFATIQSKWPNVGIHYNTYYLIPARRLKTDTTLYFQAAGFTNTTNDVYEYPIYKVTSSTVVTDTGGFKITMKPNNTYWNEFEAQTPDVTNGKLKVITYKNIVTNTKEDFLATKNYQYILAMYFYGYTGAGVNTQYYCMPVTMKEGNFYALDGYSSSGRMVTVGIHINSGLLINNTLLYN